LSVAEPPRFGNLSSRPELWVVRRLPPQRCVRLGSRPALRKRRHRRVSPGEAEVEAVDGVSKLQLAVAVGVAGDQARGHDFA